MRRVALVGLLAWAVLVAQAVLAQPQRPKCTKHEFKRTADSSYFEVACPRPLEPTLP